MTRTILRYVLGTTIGFVAAACGDDDNGASAFEINAGCKAYCDRAHTCNDDVAVDSCVSDCKSRIADCMADEQAETVDDLHGCADDACNEFGACSVGANLQCTFGI